MRYDYGRGQMHPHWSTVMTGYACGVVKIAKGGAQARRRGEAPCHSTHLPREALDGPKVIGAGRVRHKVDVNDLCDNGPREAGG